jgi:benzoyl-CoA 2,3-dioxygenase component B
MHPHDDSIPNNVGLADDEPLRRTLAAWMPGYREWWRTMTPPEFHDREILLRTATSADRDDWGHYDFVRLPDYRWGVFLTPAEAGRTIGFGDHRGQPVWQAAPPAHLELIRRLLVTQADTESASVEQQRHLSATAPSLYDLRNLFQVNVEEARHVWAMVYLLCRLLPDGAQQARTLLARRSGDSEQPRLLHAFNQPIGDWLDFFMFTMFTDRVGKYQLLALSCSGLDPLARTCQFMLTEESHHLFVGESGIARVVRRACEIMRDAGSTDPAVVAAHGGLPLPLVQRRINLWFSLAEDLFGGEVSRNAAAYYGAGLKGRVHEADHADHADAHATCTLELPDEHGALIPREVPLRMALNELQRREFADDCERAVHRWNRIVRDTLGAAGEPALLRLPDRAFHRRIGAFAGRHHDPDGRPIDAATFAAHACEWLPTPADQAHCDRVMRPTLAPGEFAGWICPPSRGVHGHPVDFAYVRDATTPSQSSTPTTNPNPKNEENTMTLDKNQNFLDRKIDVCYTHGDQNGDGTLEPADALALAARIVAFIGEPFGTAKAQNVFKAFETFWAHMSAKMDENKDGKVSPDEWRKGMRGAFVADPNGFNAGFKPLAESVFALCDKDGNGQVSEKEFMAFQHAFGSSEANAKLAFQKLDRDRSGHLSVDELLKAWQEYYTSEDPNAPGNWLFGDVWDENVVVGRPIR